MGLGCADDMTIPFAFMMSASESNGYGSIRAQSNQLAAQQFSFVP
jgi:hypothetical protein